jgi:4-amino-4-deoxy-L-arabinose transferase-like glycosyltransferase
MKYMGSWLCAVLIGLFFLATNLHIASKRLLWFDEINTLEIAQLPDLATLWQVQNSFRGDSPPITYHLIVRLIYHLTGKAEIAVRLLSALAMSAALLVIFDCARRLTRGIHGLIAVCILAASFLTYYGYEGRPYALVVLFTAGALWLWLFTERDNKSAAVAFGVALFLAVTVQFTSVLAMVPFGLWESWHWRPWQKPSPKLLAGAAAVVCAVALCAPQMKQSAGWSAHSWCPPTFHALVTVFSEMFPTGLIVLAALAILVCLARASVKPMSDSERLCWFFLTIPFAGFILAEAVTNAFYNRYLIAMLPGVAVAFACLVWRHLTKPASVAFLLLLAGLAVGRQLGHTRHPDAIEPPSVPTMQLHTMEVLTAEDALVADGRQSIIVDFLVLKNARYYSKRPDLYVMYKSDSDPLYCKYFGSACWNTNLAATHAREAAAIYPTDILLTEMSRAGFRAIVKMTNPMVVYFSPR